MNGLVYRIGSRTRSLGRPPTFYRSSELPNSGCSYASVYAVTEQDAHAIQEEAGTAASFKGIVWSQRLWIDFDDKEAARAAQGFLDKEGYEYVAYDTGSNRGRHFGVARDAGPSHLLPYRDKVWVSQHCPGADLSLYWHLHLLRLPGAIHESTGKPKVLTEVKEGRPIQLPKYMPNETEVGAVLPGEGGGRPGVFTHWTVTSNLTPNAGISRHKQLVQLAVGMARDGKASPEETYWMLQEVNKSFDEPKSIPEIKKILEWAYDQRS